MDASTLAVIRRMARDCNSWPFAHIHNGQTMTPFKRAVATSAWRWC